MARAFEYAITFAQPDILLIIVDVKEISYAISIEIS